MTESVGVPDTGVHRWGLLEAGIVLATHFGGFVVAALLVDKLTPATFFLSFAVPTTLAALLAVAISVTRGNGPVRDFGLPTSAAQAWQQMRVGLGWGTASVFGGLTIAVVLLQFDDFPTDSPLTEVALPPGWKVVVALWVWLCAPIGEELIFRGAVWGALERHRINPWLVLVVTALLFAGWHAEPWRLPILIWGGLAIGMARLQAGSVFSSWTAHSMNNALPALAVLFLPS